MWLGLQPIRSTVCGQRDARLAVLVRDRLGGNVYFVGIGKEQLLQCFFAETLGLRTEVFVHLQQRLGKLRLRLLVLRANARRPTWALMTAELP